MTIGTISRLVRRRLSQDAVDARSAADSGKGAVPTSTRSSADASWSPGALVCPNCGSPLLRRYCPDCGQAAPDRSDYSLRAYAKDLVDQFASVDGKAVRTFWTLIARPGTLTLDHLEGRRASYLRPLQLFLVVNVVLFAAAPKTPMFSYSLQNYLNNSPPSPALVSALVERATSTSSKPAGSVVPLPSKSGSKAVMTREAYVPAFDGRVEAQRKSLIILFAPALALVLRVLFGRRANVPRRYGEHLVFALHVMTFVWLVFTGWGIAVAITNGMATSTLEKAAFFAVVLALFLATPWYLFLALRRVYGLSTAGALAVTAALGAAFVGLLVAYRSLLFFTTYYTL